MQTQKNHEVFESMPVARALATLAIPTIISQLITMIYNFADTFFIGRTNDPYKVAAASLAFVLFFALNALANLFGVGGGSLISRLLGAGEEEDARRVSAFSFYGAIGVAVLYCAVCLVGMEPLLRLLGASDQTAPHAREYVLWVVVLGGVPATLNMTMAHLLRSDGYARLAGVGLSLGGVLNIALDPLFMFVLLSPGNEVKGAAVATALSNTVALAFFLVVFVRLRGRSVLSMRPANAARIRPCHVRSVFAVGLPSALASLISCLANTAINKLTSLHGDIPLAAMGIVKKIDMLPMNVGMGLCQGMMPLVAYNYANGNHRRMRAAASCARVAGMGFAVLCIITFEIFAQGIMRLFINEAETLELGTQFLRICCVATPFVICNFQMNYTFQAIGKAREALILSVCRQGLIYIPLMFVLDALFGLYGLASAQLVADALTTLLSLFLYRRVIAELPGKVATR